MAFELIRMQRSYNSTNAITDQFVFVKLDPNNANSVILPAANDYCVGVSQDKPNAGDPTDVCGIGDITKVLCGGSIAIGQDVMCDGTGKAVAAASSGYVLGTALTAGTANYLAVILYQPRGNRGVA